MGAHDYRTAKKIQRLMGYNWIVKKIKLSLTLLFETVQR